MGRRPNANGDDARCKDTLILLDMLTRVYVDNFRCFVNFEFRPMQKKLLLGAMGAASRRCWKSYDLSNTLSMTT